jgi:hypothetical protein
VPKPGTITQGSAIKQVAKQINGPISLDAFVDRVLEIWSSKAKNPKANIRQSIHYDHLGKDLLLQDEKTLLPIHLAMQGIRFRVPLSRQEAENGWLFAFPSFQYMFQQSLRPEDFRFEEVYGRSIPVNPVTVKYKEKTIFGVEEFETTAFELGWWYEKYKVRRKDNLLVTILDWETARFQLRPEPAREYKKHKADIWEHNQSFADHLFKALEAARYEELRGYVAIPTAYVCLKDHQTYPADHWVEIIEHDPRMKWSGYDIRYADWHSPLDNFFTEKEPHPLEKPKPLSDILARQVFHFKAYLWHRKGLWRRIEIQGEQTLVDLDGILRDAFEHDHSDHLSGFWKLVRRGETRRFREIDLGTINPFEGGGAAEVQVADIHLEPGNALKYVYDFGDWIEHRIELESIGKPEQDTLYPRIVAKNKPRYKNCQVCKNDGKKSVAQRICITCSNFEQRDFLICEDCLKSHDKDHYLDEMIY